MFGIRTMARLHADDSLGDISHGIRQAALRTVATILTATGGNALADLQECLVSGVHGRHIVLSSSVI